jgi:hypothetical protein
MKWISLKDQKPPHGVQILAYGNGCGEMVNGVDICVRYGPDEDWWDEGGTECCINGGFWTHWMPVPAPPEKE